MSIAMDRFGLNEDESNAPLLGAAPSSAFPYKLQCRACGFEPEDPITPPRICPKCHSSTWERFAAPCSLLKFADQCPEPFRLEPADEEVEIEN